MASIIWNLGEKSIIDAWLGGVAGAGTDYGTPPIVPDRDTPNDWGVGLGARAGGVGTTKADAIAQIIELGTGTANGYGRALIERSQGASGWPAATLIAGSYQTTGPQVEFNFSGAPSPNGATLWFLAGSTTLNADNALFGSDLSSIRTYSTGEIQRITITYRQS